MPRLLWKYVQQSMICSRRKGVYQAVPNGCIDIRINLKDPQQSAVIGPRLCGRKVYFDDSSQFAVVRFWPGAAPALLNIPAHCLQGLSVPLIDLRKDSEPLLQTIAGITSAPDALGHLHDYLVCLTKKARPANAHTTAAVHALLASRGNLSARRISEDLGISHTRLGKVFNEHVGIGPKVFGRIVRLRSIFFEGLGPSARSWADVAISAGYYDQAHMIRDFNQIAGMNPGSFFRLLAERGPFCFCMEPL